MKKIIVLLIIFAATCWAASPVFYSQLQLISGYPGACSSHTPGDPTDIMCEDSDGENTVVMPGTDWTKAKGTDAVYEQYIDTNAYFYESTDSGNFGCANKGSYVIEYYIIDDPEASQEDSGIVYDLSPDKDNVYTSLYFRVKSHSLESTERVGLLYYCSDTACATWQSYIAVGNNGGNINLYKNHKNNVNGQSTAWGSTNITVGQWYRLGHEWIRSTSMTVYLNGSSEITSTNVYNGPVTKVWVGSHIQSARISNDPVTVQMDNIGIDDDTMPPGCESGSCPSYFASAALSMNFDHGTSTLTACDSGGSEVTFTGTNHDIGAYGEGGSNALKVDSKNEYIHYTQLGEEYASGGDDQTLCMKVWISSVPDNNIELATFIDEIDYLNHIAFTLINDGDVEGYFAVTTGTDHVIYQTAPDTGSWEIIAYSWYRDNNVHSLNDGSAGTWSTGWYEENELANPQTYDIIDLYFGITSVGNDPGVGKYYIIDDWAIFNGYQVNCTNYMN